MADTLNNIILPRGVWVNLYDALSARYGSQLNIKSESNDPVLLHSGYHQPTALTEGYVTMEEWSEYDNDAADYGAWALSQASDATVNPKFISYFSSLPIFQTAYDCSNGIDPIIGGTAIYACASTAQYSAVCAADLDGDPVGTIKTAAINQPRIEAEGVLLGGVSENLFLNSQAPATQSIILAAGTYTISVVGTGSISTSYGSATEASDLTFTTAGETLLFTVVGELDTAQVEKLPFATSIIYTAASPVTRAATNLTYPVPAGFDPALFSCEVVFDSLSGLTNVAEEILTISDGTSTNNIRILTSGALDGKLRILYRKGGVFSPTYTTGLPIINGTNTLVISGGFGRVTTIVLNGSISAFGENALTPPTLTTVEVGAYLGAEYLYGHVKSLKISDYDVLAGA